MSESSSTSRRRPLRGSAPGNLTYYRDPAFSPQSLDSEPPYSGPLSSSVDLSPKDYMTTNNIQTNSLPEGEGEYCPYGCCLIESPTDYFYKRGFLEGAYSDVTIMAFGTSYSLHRLILDRSDYFQSLFKWPADEDSEYRNRFVLEFDDPRITQTSFELAISRLYGTVNSSEEKKIPYNMIAVGQYLAINEAVCTATDYIVKNMNMSNISDIMKFAVTNNYGSASERIIQNGKGILSIDGWEVGVEAWDEIPVSVIAEVVGENYFFVPTEWDRCIFIIKLLERRIEAGFDSEDILPIKTVLNDKIHYCHMSPEQLQELESYSDVYGNTYIDSQVLHKALWQAVYLQRQVLHSSSSNIASTVTTAAPPTADSKWFKVPIKDATISGLPADLDKKTHDVLSSSPTPASNENGKSTQDESPRIERLYNWTSIPPFRFSIAFANVSDLLTEKRLYGTTFWYAGSYWNLYLQKNRLQLKNTYQIGAYLHRANNGNSTPASKHGLINPDVYAGNINYQSMPRKRSQQMNMGSDGSISLSGSNLHGAEEKENVQDDSLLSLNELSFSDGSAQTSRSPVTDGRSFLTYEDQRSMIKVYFIIFTPSRRERPTITSFLSVPNDFHKSQSWGWKSNSMCVFNDDGTFPEGHDRHLKFMIVLGNI
ncbi:hypothetical protein OGAPHI_001889 [Ogataea philodendri]|uniref:BTB domain-containing protein n=1 Tax=Ogataea philodendri TaxID=1378263 RepID=A0A9P8T7G0_9ASCO|nr:uncharacterized protein OGAPHI_001889 [Ogataea philodendri]KAH3668135.1 hypothetical protein OGAPHI_001889 [Ogataea philodendri]